MTELPVRFVDHNHTYWHGDQKYISATTVVGRYKPPFDTEYWSLYKAIQREMEENDFSGAFDMHKRIVGGFKKVVPHFLEEEKDPHSTTKLYQKNVRRHQRTIKAEWEVTKKEGTDKGSRIHKQFEDAIIGARETAVGGVSFEHANAERNPLILPGDDKSMLVFTELLLWNHDYQVAGQADLVFKYHDSIIIHDYKTNKRLSNEAFQDERLLHPLDELPNTDISIYTMQLSLYGWMLEQAGYTIRGLELLHCPEEGIAPKPVPLLYRPDLVKLMLEHYESTR